MAHHTTFGGTLVETRVVISWVDGRKMGSVRRPETVRVCRKEGGLLLLGGGSLPSVVSALNCRQRSCTTMIFNALRLSALDRHKLSSKILEMCCQHQVQLINMVPICESCRGMFQIWWQCNADFDPPTDKSAISEFAESVDGRLQCTSHEDRHFDGYKAYVPFLSSFGKPSCHFNSLAVHFDCAIKTQTVWCSACVPAPPPLS